MSRLPSIYRLAQVALDAIVAILALFLAFFVRFEGTLPAQYWPLVEGILLVGIPARLLINWAFGVYRQIWRLFSLRDFWALFQAGSFYSLSLILLARLLLPKVIALPVLPLGVAVMDWGFCLAGMTCIRFLRSWQTPSTKGKHRLSTAQTKRLLLLGAGRAGAQIVRETRQNDRFNFQVVGFLDDDRSKLGRQVEGIQVLDKISQLVSWTNRLAVDEVLITMPSAPSDRIQRAVNLAKLEGIPIKIVPPMQELLSDRSLTRQIRDIRLEDLLGRPEVLLDFNQKLSNDFPSATEQIQDHVVLVTGAGGTIGSELCRQLARLQPRQLILVGRGENSIFHIDRELRQTFPNLEVVPVIADVRDTARIQKILRHFQPQVIFHAAAHKHVPLMEQNPTEAIENNTIASAKLALLADQMGVQTFVLISTDKAVAPTSFMGLSKRLAELLVSGVARQSQTRFLSVRFGNVLGSRGSVVLIFQEQIARGGPVTVTDPTMTRFFMTTPEATRLVLQSLAVGKTGQILVLDMGEPMRIYTLAEQLIRLEGYVPERDIKIQTTGIRPGEKLHEALVDEDEELCSTPHPRLNCLNKKQLHYLPVDFTLEQIETILKSEQLECLWQLLSPNFSSIAPHERAVDNTLN
ncbi:polysaccharide biosynthesis protein [Leptolyngbya iicbica]|uniref:Polysaccharide biosynthesis protein n=2 Tax=Cyanophyceae TaxID=3028117 RepID=A0A4Q7EH29_9CYAN|nr:nucleoside-diphosphate sugar epimerase/dehydratase [Leptolyngbya sp. LK]RZM82623.1 polysaccharide biosynthesis protein [Leptolyngbya sp. LK]